MTGIAVVEATGGKVEDADKEGDEHVALVHVGDGGVDGSHDAVRLRLVGGYGTEDGTCDGHEQRGWHTLA